MPADLKRGSTVLGPLPQTASPALVEVKKLQFKAVLELLKQQSQPHSLWGLPGPSPACQTFVFKAAAPQKAPTKRGSFLPSLAAGADPVLHFLNLEEGETAEPCSGEGLLQARGGLSILALSCQPILVSPDIF